MKNLIKLGFVFIFIGCSSAKNVMPYLVNIGTEKSIYNEILKLSNDKEVVFYLEHLPDSNYKLHLVSSSGKKEFLSTNRKLFINEKFYPIIFDTDYYFYSETNNGYPLVSYDDEKERTNRKIRIPTISEREKNLDLYGYEKKNLIIDISQYWIIDKKGKLLETNVRN